MRLHIYQIQLWTLLGLFSSLPFPPPLFFVVWGGGGLHCKLPLHKTSHFGLMLFWIDAIRESGDCATEQLLRIMG